MTAVRPFAGRKLLADNRETKCTRARVGMSGNRTCAGIGAETPPWRLESLGGKGWYGELPRGVPFGFQRLVRPHLLSLPPALLRRYAVYRGAPEEAETSQPSGWEAPAHSPMPMTPTGATGPDPWPADPSCRTRTAGDRIRHRPYSVRTKEEQAESAARPIFIRHPRARGRTPALFDLRASWARPGGP